MSLPKGHVLNTFDIEHVEDISAWLKNKFESGFELASLNFHMLTGKPGTHLSIRMVRKCGKCNDVGYVLQRPNPEYPEFNCRPCACDKLTAGQVEQDLVRRLLEAEDKLIANNLMDARN